MFPLRLVVAMKMQDSAVTIISVDRFRVHDVKIYNLIYTARVCETQTSTDYLYK